MLTYLIVLLLESKLYVPLMIDEPARDIVIHLGTEDAMVFEYAVKLIKSVLKFYCVAVEEMNRSR